MMQLKWMIKPLYVRIIRKEIVDKDGIIYNN
jgi:hypothetical protein